MKTRYLMPALILGTMMLAAAPILSPVLTPTAHAEVRRTDFRLDADLLAAATQGQTWQVRSLLDKGARIETRDGQNGWTPLMWAARGGHVGTVRLLLARGAKVNQRSIGSTRTYMTLVAGRTRDLGTNTRTSTDATNLNTTTTTQYLAMSSFGTANNGITPLMLASVGGFNLAAKELLNKGADVNAQTSSGETALMAAAFNGYLPLVRTLLSRGARPTVRDGQGGTALSYAVLEGHTPVVRELLQRGVPANELYMKQTPLIAVAKYFNYTEIANLLRRHGANSAKKATTAKAKNSTTANANRASNRAGAPDASGPNVIILN